MVKKKNLPYGTRLLGHPVYNGPAESLIINYLSTLDAANFY